MSSRIHHARLLSRRTLARRTEEFVLGTEEPELTFRPGQFISVAVGTDAQANPILRSYSIASPPDRRGEIVLILRMVEGGVGTAFFDRLQPGDRLRFTGPMGFFVNELAHPGDVVYAATGTGIAPILPMAQEAAARAETGRILLEWGLRDEQDIFWQRELEALQRQSPRVRVRLFLSRPSAGWPGLRGHITGPILEELPRLSQPTFYLCGNGRMVEELKAALQARGVHRKRQIRTEVFFD
ncbi:MAG: FAD-binding oxidoreductase [Myxococcales bacterium]|nr:FAD-binding oxidoreductase [Myxococcota bacterium]MDW8282930.1 FAD-binding oxidoreductase [Myxococcales bacterium]